MPRPTVIIHTPNQRAALRAHFDTILPRFAALPGVVGITLNGGLSRGYADHLSEIDVTFYLDPDTYQHWQDGHAPFGMGIQRIDGALYDLKSCNSDEERARVWDMVMRWDMSYAEIVYDPSGAIAALCQEKLKDPPQPLEASGPLFAAWWYFELAGNIWIYRGDALQGHLMLTQAITELLKALFLVNAEYVPHEKWLLHMSRTLAWTPPEWETRLTSALCELAPTVESVRQRQQVIAALWSDIDRHLRDTQLKDYPADLHVSQHYFYQLLAWLAQSGPVRVTDWNARAGMDVLNQAPFHACVRLDGEWVTLDWDRLMSLTENDLYSWHYAVVQAVRATVQRGEVIRRFTLLQKD